MFFECFMECTSPFSITMPLDAPMLLSGNLLYYHYHDRERTFHIVQAIYVSCTNIDIKFHR
jgi:hypothetical protein